MRRTTATLIVLAVSGLAVRAPAASPRQPLEPSSRRKTLNLSAYAELLRSDVRAQKVAILTEVMGFTEAEDKAFWPIYRDYDAEMAKLGDERVALIAEYARELLRDDRRRRADRSRRGRSISSERRHAALKRSTTNASRRRCRRRRRCGSCRSSTSCC